MPNHPQREATLARVNAATQELAASLTPAEAEGYNAFVRAAVSQVRTLVLLEHTPSELASDLLGLWRFARKGNQRVSVEAGGDGLVVRSVMADQPFIVDTLRLGLREAGATRIGGYNLIVREGEGPSQSVIRFEVEGVEAAAAAAVEAELIARLAIAEAMVADYESMMTRVEKTAHGAFDQGGDEGLEAAEFLRWLLGDNYVFMGITAGNERLGADRLAGSALWPVAPDMPSNDVVSLRKTPTESPVHRSGRVDLIRVNLASGPVLLRGMFTHRALTQPCRHLPILRRRLETVLADTRQRPHTWRYRGLANIFDAMPTEWLFSASTEQIREVLEQVFDADQEQVARVHVSQSDDGASTFALIAIPERRYSDAVRNKALAQLGKLTGATYTDSGIFAGRFDSVLVQVYQTGTRALSAELVESFNRFVNTLTTPWMERASGAIEAHFGDNGQALIARYGNAFPADFADETDGEQLVSDIELLEAAAADGRVKTMLQDAGADVLLRVYQPADMTLTELMPIIDNFGLEIAEQWAVRVQPRGRDTQTIDIFRVKGVTGITRDELLSRGNNLVDGLDAVFQKKMASDGFNKLLLRANLRWDEVDLVRAYVGYAKQIKLAHSYPKIQEVLTSQPGVTHSLVKLFHAKFDPELGEAREAAIGVATASVEDGLRKVPTADEDFVLRFLYNLVEATLRTNFYRGDRAFHYISFKLNHAKIRHIPLPRMMVEIYVHHYEMEGVHLRGGPIARGGLRYSDRADFRTEILGLVTTQMVKNVVIVPEGSKGGFYVKYTIEDAGERKRVGDRLYQVLIRGMLDITDNLVAGKVVPPPRVVRHDGDDPYLVVAADKGTAHLSDTANSLSKAYGFWLGDAFASGGSQGYDHKKVGITARGAWVLVKRLFREMGMDADRDEFTCFGIGDCGGDVFGNGVIETPKMKLLAAFNHVHIFLDPNPDPEKSYAERRRLFDSVGGWEKYDTALISKGGGVFSRKAKTIPLSPEVKAMLQTEADELSPTAVMNLILKMQVDLFWNGGIGTYVRASLETNADANDPPNDDLRVTAAELRCKVVGEGGNLGFTQAARIEFAQRGGRLNTDFVDNSGGVDTSDHEVNLKILLNPMVAAGRITEEQRNEILASMTDEVANMVLADNNANGRLISLDVVRSARDPFPYGRAIDWICQRGNVTRRFLILPSDDDIRRRAANGQGIVRPELAVIQAHVKMHVFKLLMAEELSSIPAADRLLRNYFPERVRREFAADLPNHMLAKAIVMTVLLTEVATDAGAAYFPMMLELTGTGAGRIAAAWTEAMRITGGDQLKADLVAARARPEGAYHAWTLFTENVQQLVINWLSPGNPGWQAEDPERFAEALAAIVATRPAADDAAAKASAAALAASGIGNGLADRIVAASNAVAASEICAVAQQRGESIRDAAVLYQSVAAASRLGPTVRLISARRGEGRWDPVALGIQRIRYQALLHELVVQSPVAGASLKYGVERGAEAVATERVKAVADVVARVVGEQPDVAALLVGEQRIRAVM